MTKSRRTSYSSSSSDIVISFGSCIFSPPEKSGLVLLLTHPNGNETTISEKLFKNFDITILTPDIEIFKQKLGSLTEFITIKTVLSKELSNEYKTADLGFILRDDSNVNKVACPTKLIEYLQFGIIPIIKQPEIGDFASLGYQYIKLDDLLCNGIPSLEELSKIRINNYLVIDKLNKQHDIGMNQLQSLLKN